MQPGSTAHTEAPYPPQGTIVRIGGWLFEQRSWLPVPIALILLLIPASTDSWLVAIVGFSLVAAGESLRLWAVHQIGTISRTRSQRVGPLIATGPFGLVRNPLYLGNIALWIGFALSARLPWAAPIVLLLLAAEYHAIVKWEEGLLVVRLGDPYLAYLSRVPRWVPSFRGAASVLSPPLQMAHSWRETIFSERGTLIAIAVGYLLLAVKNAMGTGGWGLAAGG